VSFRAATRATASALGLIGWVRNEIDGTVRVEAEGEAEAVERLVAWLRQGPPGAHVSTVDVERRPATGEDRRFEVRF
jgi:acylphosphatase